MAEVVGGPPCHSFHHRAAPEQEQGRGKLLLPLEEAPPGLIFFPHHLSSPSHPSLLVVISSFFLSLFLLSSTLDLLFLSFQLFFQRGHEVGRRVFFKVRCCVSWPACCWSGHTPTTTPAPSVAGLSRPSLRPPTWIVFMYPRLCLVPRVANRSPAQPPSWDMCPQYTSWLSSQEADSRATTMC